jgi:hypothetical protein
MNQEYDFNSWLTEDLEEYHKELIKERSRCETYSERADLNKIMRNVSEEIQSRKERNL